MQKFYVYSTHKYLFPGSAYICVPDFIYFQYHLNNNYLHVPKYDVDRIKQKYIYAFANKDDTFKIL